jgi:hypothetical protein
MEKASIIGVDLAKHGFQVHGACADGSVAFRKKISRVKFLPFLSSQPRCVVAMEACASAHSWRRDISARPSARGRFGRCLEASLFGQPSIIASSSLFLPSTPVRHAGGIVPRDQTSLRGRHSGRRIMGSEGRAVTSRPRRVGTAFRAAVTFHNALASPSVPEGHRSAGQADLVPRLARA